MSLNTCIDSVKALIEDAEMLSQAAVAGKLSVRADAARHNGDFGKVIAGVNSALDSVINPLMVLENYVAAYQPRRYTAKADGCAERRIREFQMQHKYLY